MAVRDEPTFVKDQELLTKADDLTSQLLSETSASKAAMIRGKIEGLLHLAHIRSLATQYENGREATEFRTRELAAMEQMSANVETVAAGAARRDYVPICIALNKRGLEKCVLPAGHRSRHESGGVAPLSWPNDDPYPEPTKSAADRLHELVSYCMQQSDAANLQSGRDEELVLNQTHRAESLAYADVGSKLSEILKEGTL